VSGTIAGLDSAALDRLRTRLGPGVAAALREGWPAPGTLSARDRADAVRFYQAVRARDAALERVLSQAGALVGTWTGCVPREIGSFGLRANLPDSDLDLGIGYPPRSRENVIALLSEHAAFLGDQPTRFGPRRLAFALSLHSVRIDITALPEPQFASACRLAEQAAAAMTDTERADYTWIKHLLASADEREALAAWKLAPYAHLRPGFAAAV
jgi:hypothetical protein